MTTSRMSAADSPSSAMSPSRRRSSCGSPTRRRSATSQAVMKIVAAGVGPAGHGRCRRDHQLPGGGSLRRRVASGHHRLLLGRRDDLAGVRGISSEFKAGVAWYGRMVPPPTGGDPGRVVAGDRCRATARAGAGPLRRQGCTSQPVSRPCGRPCAAAHKTDSEIIVYPDAGHGFHADYRDSYNAADATDGWTRMLAFFARARRRARSLTPGASTPGACASGSRDPAPVADR